MFDSFKNGSVKGICVTWVTDCESKIQSRRGQGQVVKVRDSFTVVCEAVIAIAAKISKDSARWKIKGVYSFENKVG